MQQFDLNYDGRLIDQFPNWRDVVRASVYDCGKPFKVIAADLDMSTSELSRKLADNPNDNVEFPLVLFPKLLEATRDMRPIYWLVESFCVDAETKHRQAMAELAHLMPMLTRLVKDAAGPR